MHRSFRLVGERLSEKDHIDEGIYAVDDTFVVAIDSRLDPYSVEDIESLLLSQEARIEKHRRKLYEVLLLTSSMAEATTLVFITEEEEGLQILDVVVSGKFKITSLCVNSLGKYHMVFTELLMQVYVIVNK